MTGIKFRLFITKRNHRESKPESLILSQLELEAEISINGYIFKT